MNPLPTAPEAVATPELRRRYFRDMKRWGFNVAYNAYYAFPLRAVRGKYRPIYRAFAGTARREGYPACIQIQATVADLADVPLSESQYYLTNECLTYKHHPDIGKQNFFASYSSQKWRRFLKELIDTFHAQGYRWVVFEEPMYRVDVPGTRDRFYQVFRRRYPGLPYPERHEETEAYARVQLLKQEILVDFLDDLARHAKKTGFEKIGVMPWFFTPTHENTPEETWHTSCDLGRIHHLPSIDFIVVRMQPDNIFAGAMSEQHGLALPRLAYLENLAHQGGKPIIAVNNPSNEHLPRGSIDYYPLPQEYFSRFTLAAAAAAPHGMTRHWYGKNYGDDLQQMALYKRVNPLLDRLGGAAGPVALVYSYRGLIHALPRSAKQMWTPYARVAGQLLYEDKMPALTLYADSLAQGLETAPEVDTLVLFEEYPISPEEIALLRRWIASDSRRRLVLFGRGRGETYDPARRFFHYDDRPPEMVELFGLRTDRPFAPAGLSETAQIRFAGKDPSGAFLGRRFSWRCYGWGKGTFRKSRNLEALYVEQRTGTPVITRYQYPGGGQAYFIAQGWEGPKADFPLANFLTQITPALQRDFPRVECSAETLWNVTRNGYLIIANTAPEAGWARLSPGRRKIWNVQKKQFERNRSSKIRLQADEIVLYRLLAPGDPILDVQGQIYLSRIDSDRRSALLTGYFGRTTVLRTSLRPVRIEWVGQKTPCRIVHKDGYYETRVRLEEPAEGAWRVIFKPQERKSC